jgi:curved DNA-binding protein CbpA
VYRILAARLHPDNAKTGDADKFLLLQQAYQTLSDPASREVYDARYHGAPAAAPTSFTPGEFIDDVWGESRRRLAILCVLYHQRRRDPDHPSVGLLEFMQLMSCDQETLVFSLWYLREKHYIQSPGGSDYTITVAGVEQVEAEAPAARSVFKLLESTRTPAGATEASATVM